MSQPLIRFSRAGRCYSTTSATSRHNQTLTLPDGRTLGFAEFGVPNGKPLLYFHGYPSCRLEPTTVEEMITRQGIRLLALDRPGFGLSTPQKGRQMVDWPDDVRAFAEAMKLQRFAVMGLSGGGPYALAVAYRLPSLVGSVGLLASGPPWAAGAHYMTRTRRIARFLSVHFPIVLKGILASLVGATKWALRRVWIKNMLDKWLLAAQEKARADRGEVNKTLTEKHVKPPVSEIDELVRTLLAEPFAQGAAAAVEEARLLTEPDWGFKLEDVAFPNVKIWHGKKDVNAPIEAIRYLAGKVPSSTLYESDDSHYTMARHMEAAMAELVKDI